MIKNQYVVLVSERDLYVCAPMTFPNVIQKNAILEIVNFYYKEFNLPKNDFKLYEIFCFEDYCDALKFFLKRFKRIITKLE